MGKRKETLSTYVASPDFFPHVKYYLRERQTVKSCTEVFRRLRLAETRFIFREKEHYLGYIGFYTDFWLREMKFRLILFLISLDVFHASADEIHRYSVTCMSITVVLKRFISARGQERTGQIV